MLPRSEGRAGGKGRKKRGGREANPWAGRKNDGRHRLGTGILNNQRGKIYRDKDEARKRGKREIPKGKKNLERTYPSKTHF